MMNSMSLSQSTQEIDNRFAAVISKIPKEHFRHGDAAILQKQLTKTVEQLEMLLQKCNQQQQELEEQNRDIQILQIKNQSLDSQHTKINEYQHNNINVSQDSNLKNEREVELVKSQLKQEKDYSQLLQSQIQNIEQDQDSRITELQQLVQSYQKEHPQLNLHIQQLNQQLIEQDQLIQHLQMGQLTQNTIETNDMLKSQQIQSNLLNTNTQQDIKIEQLIEKNHSLQQQLNKQVEQNLLALRSQSKNEIIPEIEIQQLNEIVEFQIKQITELQDKLNDIETFNNQRQVVDESCSQSIILDKEDNSFITNLQYQIDQLKNQVNQEQNQNIQIITANQQLIETYQNKENQYIQCTLKNEQLNIEKQFLQDQQRVLETRNTKMLVEQSNNKSKISEISFSLSQKQLQLENKEKTCILQDQLIIDLQQKLELKLQFIDNIFEENSLQQVQSIDVKQEYIKNLDKSENIQQQGIIQKSNDIKTAQVKSVIDLLNQQSQNQIFELKLQLKTSEDLLIESMLNVQVKEREVEKLVQQLDINQSKYDNYKQQLELQQTQFKSLQFALNDQIAENLYLKKLNNQYQQHIEVKDNLINDQIQKSVTLLTKSQQLETVELQQSLKSQNIATFHNAFHNLLLQLLRDNIHKINREPNNQTIQNCLNIAENINSGQILIAIEDRLKNFSHDEYNEYNQIMKQFNIK
ncbi:hypothetical protein SS50377_20187 [Spironucleus salmonicida]|uniref:Uncharacterized protein n=2 Tax=Spironucleus salmonicida TaxID=348837 RepID=A0A9P8LYS3_9EUKA|nr:hypothetical protein SS50377_20187 [Spironucleus salmonicida]